MLDKLGVGLNDGILLGISALSSGLENVKFIAAYDGFAEAGALLNVKESIADTTLFSEQVALVLDYHFDRRLELAYCRVV